MNSVKKVSSIALASAAAALLLTGCSATGYTPTKAAGKAHKVSMGKVECSGINACKGASSCQTASSACKGLNSCKGKGWIPETKANCLSKGGKVGKATKM
ncbi:MAG: hypothetical protein KAG34_08030 [Cocleimonas sp.]|nr:hypothetical protein [Cocleimonas sp.]